MKKETSLKDEILDVLAPMIQKGFEKTFEQINLLKDTVDGVENRLGSLEIRMGRNEIAINKVHEFIVDHQDRINRFEDEVFVK